MYRVTLYLCVAAAAIANAATLERLSLDEMIAKSTAIVHARVNGSYAAASGRIVYTHYAIQVSETWKGQAAAKMDVAIPGGAVRGFRQIFPGAPALSPGQDYVLFLWTSSSGLTQIIGLSQGLFSVVAGSGGEPTATRAPSHELMLDKAGRRVQDDRLQMPLTKLRARVRQTLSAGATK